jgi:hypothetical protein
LVLDAWTSTIFADSNCDTSVNEVAISVFCRFEADEGGESTSILEQFICSAPTMPLGMGEIAVLGLVGAALFLGPKRVIPKLAESLKVSGPTCTLLCMEKRREMCQQVMVMQTPPFSQP